jgi:hypothetical protein
VSINGLVDPNLVANPGVPFANGAHHAGARQGAVSQSRRGSRRSGGEAIKLFNVPEAQRSRLIAPPVEQLAPQLRAPRARALAAEIKFPPCLLN